MQMLAALMAIACAATTVACVVVLVAGRYLGWSGIDVPGLVALTAAIVVAIAGPRLAVGSGMTTTS